MLLNMSNPRRVMRLNELSGKNPILFTNREVPEEQQSSKCQTRVLPKDEVERMLKQNFGDRLHPVTNKKPPSQYNFAEMTKGRWQKARAAK